MLGHIFGSAQLSIHSLPWWPLVANNLGKRVSILQSVTLRRLHVPLVQKIFGRWLCFYIGHSVCILPYIVSHPSKAVGSLIIYLISCLVNPRGKTWLRMGDCLRVWKERWTFAIILSKLFVIDVASEIIGRLPRFSN